MYKIQVMYHNEAAKPIGQAHDGEWCDLRLAEDVEIEAGGAAILNLGVSIKVPDGCEAIMAPRSSAFKHYGLMLTNSIGVFDGMYCGNEDVWKMSVYATRNANIPAGTRIAQFRVQENQGTLEIEEVDDMNCESRGGIGSTGKM